MEKEIAPVSEEETINLLPRANLVNTEETIKVRKARVRAKERPANISRARDREYHR